MKTSQTRSARTSPARSALALVLLVASCRSSTSGSSDLERRVRALLSEMSLEEKVEQMHGAGAFSADLLSWTPDNERLHIPGFHMVDGPRGVNSGYATAFPVGSARGATWDVDLERRIGEAIALEAEAKGANVLLAPVINVLRHPAWGRAQETYGEDPHHLGEMGKAFIEGAQEHLIASAKHFALYSIEDKRFVVDVSASERAIREVYLPHFEKAVVKAKVGSVMSSYNKVNGRFASENPHLIRDILKGEWAFDGFVESDWLLGTHSTGPAVSAGLDIEMPIDFYFGQRLVDAVRDGGVKVAFVDESVSRILRKKLEFGLDRKSEVPKDVVESRAHADLALEAAREAIVLLKNEASLLPLDRARVRSIAVIGRLSRIANLGDNGSSRVTPSRAVSPLAGIEAHAGSAVVTSIASDVLTSTAADLVRAADAAIVVVGLTGEDESEQGNGGGDRETLELHQAHRALIQAVAAANPKTIVICEGGAAITMVDWIDAVPALLDAWYPGQEGGTAIAEVLFGEVNPSGKLPAIFPRSADQLPGFDDSNDAIEYGDRHGYRLADEEGFEPQFPFGFGLSYTSWSYENLALSSAKLASGGRLDVSFDLVNTGSRAGDEIVELYVGAKTSKVARPRKELRAFARVHVEPRERVPVKLEVEAADLAYWDSDFGAWRVEETTYHVGVGGSSRDLVLGADFTIGR
jgi:beta-glucosidase